MRPWPGTGGRAPRSAIRTLEHARVPGAIHIFEYVAAPGGVRWVTVHCVYTVARRCCAPRIRMYEMASGAALRCRRVGARPRPSVALFDSRGRRRAVEPTELHY